MANGIENVKTEQNYTTEELFQIIENCNFTAGKPELKGKGKMKKIKLPAVGKYCIIMISGGKRVQLTAIQDMEQTDEMVKSQIIGRFMGIFSGLLDKDKQPSYELLKKTAEELKTFLGQA